MLDQQDNYVEALLSANKRIDAVGRITGVLCFLHVTSPELMYAMQMQRASKQVAADSIKKLAYVRQEIKRPLSGIMLMHNLMGSSDLKEEQKQLLKKRRLCQDQLAKIVDDTDLEGIEEWYVVFFLFQIEDCFAKLCTLSVLFFQYQICSAHFYVLKCQ